MEHKAQLATQLAGFNATKRAEMEKLGADHRALLATKTQKLEQVLAVF